MLSIFVSTHNIPFKWPTQDARVFFVPQAKLKWFVEQFIDLNIDDPIIQCFIKWKGHLVIGVEVQK